MIWGLSGVELRKCMRKIAWKFLFISFQTTKVCSDNGLLQYEGYRGKFSSDTKLACLLLPFSAIGLYPFAYRSQENIKNFCCPIRVSLTRGSPAKRRELKHRSPIKKKSPKKNAPTETTMSDSSNSTCVSCRFPGKMFLFSSKHVVQNRESTCRFSILLFNSGAPFVSKLFVDVIFNVTQHVL